MAKQLRNKQLLKVSLLSLYATFALEAGISNATPVSRLEDWRFSPEALQLEITLSAPSQPRYFYLSQPSRIVVDLPSTEIGDVSTQQNFSGPIKSIRVSQLNADVTRVVMDLAPGIFIDPQKVQLQPVSPQNPTRWVLRPVTTSNNTYSTPTNWLPANNQPANPGIYNPPPPSSNQSLPATGYYNSPQLPTNQPPTTNHQQLPLVTVPPLPPKNSSQLPNSALPPAIFPSQPGNLNSIPFFPTSNSPDVSVPSIPQNKSVYPNTETIEFGQPLPN